MDKQKITEARKAIDTAQEKTNKKKETLESPARR
jgi:hypothetical protein